MKKQYYVSALVLVVLGTAALFVYKTSITESIALVQPTAEFAGVSLKLNYATMERTREIGLSGRPHLGEDEAMLFAFPKDDYYGFWMKDMLIPIDIFWLDSQGHVVFIESDVTPSSYPHVFYPHAPARYVLETVAGFAREHAVMRGTALLLKNFPSVTQ